MSFQSNAITEKDVLVNITPENFPTKQVFIKGFDQPVATIEHEFVDDQFVGVKLVPCPPTFTDPKLIWRYAAEMMDCSNYISKILYIHKKQTANFAAHVAMNEVCSA